MNFAYNYLSRLNNLKQVLLGQFMTESVQAIEVSLREHPGNVKEERFYHEGSDKVLCRIMYRPNGITYYERKSKEEGRQGNPEKHQAVFEDSQRVIRADE